MYRYISLFLFSLLGTFCHGQKSSSVDFIAGAGTAYLSLDKEYQEQMNTLLFDGRDGASRFLNWKLGINYNKQIKNHLFIKTGIRLESIGFKDERFKDLRWPSEHDGNGGFMLSPDLNHDIQNAAYFWYIGLPVHLRYELEKNKIQPFFEIGLAAKYFALYRVKKETEIKNFYPFSFSEKQNTANTFHMTANASAGFNYNLSEQVQIFTQLQICSPFIKILDLYEDFFLLTTGIEIGFRKIF